MRRHAKPSPPARHLCSGSRISWITRRDRWRGMEKSGLLDSISPPAPSWLSKLWPFRLLSLMCGASLIFAEKRSHGDCPYRHSPADRHGAGRGGAAAALRRGRSGHWRGRWRRSRRLSHRARPGQCADPLDSHARRGFFCHQPDFGRRGLARLCARLAHRSVDAGLFWNTWCSWITCNTVNWWRCPGSAQPDSAQCAAKSVTGCTSRAASACFQLNLLLPVHSRINSTRIDQLSLRVESHDTVCFHHRWRGVFAWQRACVCGSGGGSASTRIQGAPAQA